MKTVRDIPILENIPVLVRTALNVPVENGKVTNTFRLRQSLPTIEFLMKKGARVILASHITGTGTETFAPMYEALKEFMPTIAFSPESTGPAARQAVRDLPPGGVLLLENLRRNKGEEGNAPEFAAALAELADVFVQDSFDTCHRKHASIIGVPALLPSYAGLQVEKEVQELSKALAPAHPALAIIGGAKFSTKEPIITRLLALYDRVFVGGAIANDFLKAGGFPVGDSVVSGSNEEGVLSLLTNPKITLPIDSMVAPKHATVSSARVASLTDVAPNEAILDAGPKSIESLAALVADAKSILWNGPLGNFENGFTNATYGVASLIAKSSAHSIVGGGDTVAAIEAQNASEHFSFISTGGGAMLDFLADGTLPGLAALEKHS